MSDDGLRAYLLAARSTPFTAPLPDDSEVFFKSNLTSHVGAYFHGYSDGNVAGQQLIIDRIMDYLDSEEAFNSY